jgi:hypothetical protein
MCLVILLLLLLSCPDGAAGQAADKAESPTLRIGIIQKQSRIDFVLPEDSEVLITRVLDLAAVTTKPAGTDAASGLPDNIWRVEPVLTTPANLG